MRRRPFAGLATAGLMVIALGAAGALASSGASPSRWSITASPNPKAPSGQLLFGACASASSCVAVGTYVTDSKRGVTLAERWDGRTWSIQRPANPDWSAVSVLDGVACTSGSACVAVGTALKPSGVQVSLIEQWTSHGWRIVPSPSPSGAQRSGLFAVACASASSCFAVGAYDTHSGAHRNLVEQWDGHRWRLEPTPTLTGIQFTFLSDVSCTAPSACTAVGGTDQGAVAERWNGHQWRLQHTPNISQGGAGLAGVDCTSSSSCTAVGGSNAGTLAERWNGKKWNLQPSSTPRGTQRIFLNNVVCTGRSSCTAVGAYQPGNAGDFKTLAEHWNGSKWTAQQTASPGGAQGDFLFAVSCPSSSGCTAFGFSDGSNTPLPMVQRLKGGRWHLARTPIPKGAAESSLSGVSCIRATWCMAVGVGAERALSQRWDGTRWRNQPIPTVPGVFLNAVSCPSRTACFAVGGSSSGTLAERWNGTRWTVQHIPTPTGAQMSGLSGISCSSASFCMAAGGYSTTSNPNGPVKPYTERWNGQRWMTISTPNPAGSVQTFLGGTSCTSPSACTVVGEQHFADGMVHTVAERWNGTTWTIQSTSNPGAQFSSLSGVSCPGPSECLAVGGSQNGTLAERWNGTTWSVQPTPNVVGGGGLGSVACASPTACTAVGFGFGNLGGVIIAARWIGTRWSNQPMPLIPGVGDISNPAVACPSRTACTMVGGYENDPPTSVTLAMQWRGGLAKTHAAAAGSPRPLLLRSPTYRPVPLPPALAAELGSTPRALAGYRTQSWSNSTPKKGWY